MMLNSRIFELNTRVWIKKFPQGTTLSTVPADFFKDLKDNGIDIIWLMGIWETCPSSVEKFCFQYNLTNSYSKALKEWTNDDVIGSPYAINDYKLAPMFGSCDDLIKFREMLNSIGLKLFLDFIPNHFNTETCLLESHPDIFLQADEESFNRDNFTFFRSPHNNNIIFAHGRDPLFPAWDDTVQLNFFSPAAREFLINTLLHLSDICDGVRCDMAMLALNNVFHNTWLGVITKFKIEKPQIEFWSEAIAKVKEKNNDFIFMAEVYWDLEWQLQQLGFDLTYDKVFLDRLASNDIYGVKAHLTADPGYQARLVRFLENHDEQRAVTNFGKQRSLAAATILFTTPGCKLLHDGQFEGKKIKLPVQLGREPEEKISNTIKNYYQKLLQITNCDVFKRGFWHPLEPEPVATDNFSCDNFFAWQWQLNSERRIVIINYSEVQAQCKVRFPLEISREEFTFNDLISNEKYTRAVNEIRNGGLFVDLKPFHSHIFAFKE
jgi:glycosidase